MNDSRTSVLQAIYTLYHHPTTRLAFTSHSRTLFCPYEICTCEVSVLNSIKYVSDVIRHDARSAEIIISMKECTRCILVGSRFRNWASPFLTGQPAGSFPIVTCVAV
jgi:hypothetical protein